MKKILSALLLTSSTLLLHAADLKTNIDKDFVKVLNNLPHTVNTTTLQEMGMQEKSKTLSRKESIRKEYEKFKSAIDQITDKDYKQLALNRYKEGIEYLENKENITLFYFISQDTNEESIRNFMVQIDVLHSHNENIIGRIMLNNYPDNYKDSYQGDLKKTVIPLSKESGKGYLELNENGKYTYKVKSLDGMSIGEKYQDIFSYENIDKTKGTIKINLRVNKESELKVLGETIVDSMVPYLRNLRSKKIGSKNVKIHVHPWAFDTLELKKVPAYVLGYCDVNDFKFRECENKFVAKGNITLEYFMSLVSERDKDYTKLYDLFKEGKK